MANLGLSKVFIADLQVLGSAFCFGIGFLGQRAVSVEGLGPMTCNAFRFGLSTIILAACLPFIPPESPPEVENDSDGEDDEDMASDPLLTPNKSIADVEINSTISSKQTRDSSIQLIHRILGPYAVHISTLKKTVWFWGIMLGTVNFAGSGFQQ